MKYIKLFILLSYNNAQKYLILFSRSLKKANNEKSLEYDYNKKTINFKLMI